MLKTLQRGLALVGMLVALATAGQAAEASYDDAATRLDKSPKTGDYVEVRGQLVDGGGIAVERIRRR